MLRYSNPEAEWSNYHQMMLDPVTFWEAEWSGFGDLSLYERKQLAVALYSKVHDQLAKDYQMVRDTSEGGLHMEVQRTGAAGSGASVETQIFDGGKRRTSRRCALWASRLRYRLCSARGSL